ncbi:MAG: DEAD/DEAH box helicase [Puia sp.]|nr:DEAD/DEAH box helicase [Puia sp.]
MNKEEYLTLVSQRMQNVLDDATFINYKNQTTAKKLSVSFNSTYQENYLWNRALFLSSNGATLIIERMPTRTAMGALKQSAEVFENLHLVSTQYDKAYCLILSALCYDLAGYQANALCLLRNTEPYAFQPGEDGIVIDDDNYIISQIRDFLLKKVPWARRDIRNPRSLQIDELSQAGIELFNNAMTIWYANILDGARLDINVHLSNALGFYTRDFRIHITQLLHLLCARAVLYEERSVWNRITGDGGEFANNSIWIKYLKILTNDPYERTVVKEIDRRISKFELWTSQLRAIEMGLLREQSNFIIQMPTSAGKTFVAELAIVNALIKHPGKKCIYVAPFRALTNEKEDELANILNKLGFSVSALSGSYEMDEFQEIILEDTDVLIATPEKLDFLFRQNPNYFNQISLVVVDEGHIVGDVTTRASLTEFLVVRFKMAAEPARILFISAVMPPLNANEYSTWLNGESDKVIRSLLFPDSTPAEEWEPTRKLIGNFSWSGDNGRITYRNLTTDPEGTRRPTEAFVPRIIRKRQFGGRYPDGDNKAQTSASLAFVLSATGNCLVFCAQVRDTTRVGAALLTILSAQSEVADGIPEWFSVDQESESWFYARKWFGPDSTVTRCIERGIGIHYGDMPEAVRRSVELDYSSGKLRVLLSTNTVGQGINFPIKYLIVHSTLITVGVPLTYRDFWNIVGRAGRAGKETEGQVIFVVKSSRDKREYSKYTDKANIEPGYSIFLVILEWLRRRRISQDQFQRFMELIVESYLMDLLAEETIGTDDQVLIERIIGNSLFKVQADLRNYDLQPVRSSFTSIAATIRLTVDENLLAVFGKTGFTLKSNQAISTFIDQRLETMTNLVQTDDYLSLLEQIFMLFSEGTVDEIKSEKLSKLGRSATEILPAANAWIGRQQIEELQEIWRSLSNDVSHLHILLADGFYYRYAWGVTSFTTILVYKLGIVRETLQENISNLASFLKYGTNNKTACLAMSMGIKSREAAFTLAANSGNLTGRDFIRWLANLTNEDILPYGFNRFEQSNVIAIANKVTSRRFEEVPVSFNFNIRGIPFVQERMDVSRTINVHDELNYERERTNEFDPYAIKILARGIQVGYVPREYARLISVEIDVNNTSYRISVIQTANQGTYSIIEVDMVKQ